MPKQCSFQSTSRAVRKIPIGCVVSRAVVQRVLVGTTEVCNMNWDQMEGQWKQMRGKMKEKWGKLTDSDWDQIAGKRDQFLGKLQERYGYSRDQAEKDLNEWESSE